MLAVYPHMVVAHFFQQMSHSFHLVSMQLNCKGKVNRILIENHFVEKHQEKNKPKLLSHPLNNVFDL